MAAPAGTNSPRFLVVGGQSRNVGKTALVVDLIRAFPEAEWVAVKITPYGHAVSAVNGEACECAPRDRAVALDLESDPSRRSDTSRFLAAGARRALWLRTGLGRLDEGLPVLLDALGREATNIIVESNSLLGLLEPQLYLLVLDPAVSDFKESAKQFLGRADAFVVRGSIKEDWEAVPKRILKRRPRFRQVLGQGLPAGAISFVRERFFGGDEAAND